MTVVLWSFAWRRRTLFIEAMCSTRNQFLFPTSVAETRQPIPTPVGSHVASCVLSPLLFRSCCTCLSVFVSLFVSGVSRVPTVITLPPAPVPVPSLLAPPRALARGRVRTFSPRARSGWLPPLSLARRAKHHAATADRSLVG